jgi:hypothetical protein
MVAKRSLVGVVAAALVAALVGAVCALLSSPRGCNATASFPAVFGVDVPNGVTCVGERLVTAGRDRDTYAYRVVLGGDYSVLRDLLAELGFQELSVTPPAGAWHMRAHREKWWRPASVTGTGPYQMFERRPTGEHVVTNEAFLLAQAELSSNTLHLVQFGSLASLP